MAYKQGDFRKDKTKAVKLRTVCSVRIVDVQ